MVGKKSTAVVSTVSYYNSMTSIAVVLHLNIPTAEHENFMIHLTVQAHTMHKGEKKITKKRHSGAELMFLFLTGVRSTAVLCVQQITEMRII